MRQTFAWALAAMVCTGSGAARAAETIKLGEPTTAAETFGPGDLICDLNKCRLFNLPSDPARYSARALVEFGFPGMSGQDRFVIRRCTGTLCKATVTGKRTTPTSRPESANPTIFVVPVEIVVQ